MSYVVIKQDITSIRADTIVNASNGVGFMGGTLAKFIKFKGIAETIQYETKGAVEKETKRIAKKSRYIPRYFYCYKPGEVFITSAGNLKAKHIIHAVTMRFPGMITNIHTVEKLLPKILEKAYELNSKSLVIPLLGTGTGRISKNKVFNLYDHFFSKINDIEIIVCHI